MKKRAHIDPFSFQLPMLVDLESFQRDALIDIATRVPHETDDELLKLVISRGIVAILAEDPEGENVTLKLEALKERLQELPPVADPGLSARATRPFPKPSVMFKKRKQENEAIDGLKDIGFAIEPTPQDHVERYVGFPISEETKRRLEDVLDAHPGLSEEDALAELLEAGIDRAEAENEAEDGATQSSARKKSKGMLRLAEALYARAKRRCGS